MADEKKPARTKEQWEALIEGLVDKQNAQDAEIAALKARDLERETELEAAKQELATARRAMRRVDDTAGAATVAELVPYEGLVRATEKCVTDRFHEAGDVFMHSVPALWTDDPFVPVMQVGTRLDVDGNEVAVYGPNTDAPKAIPFRLRPKANLGNDPEPKRASTY